MGELIFAPLSASVKGEWSKEQQLFMLNNHKTMFIEDIAEHVGKTVRATKNKAFRMGCSIKSKPAGEV